MKLVIHDSLQRPQVIQATRVVVYDSFDNPIAFALKCGETPDGKELVALAHIGEPGGEHAFNQAMKEQGIDKTVTVVDTNPATPLDQIRFNED